MTSTGYFASVRGARELARVVRRDTYTAPTHPKPRGYRCSACGRPGFTMVVTTSTGIAISCACGHSFGDARHP